MRKLMGYISSLGSMLFFIAGWYLAEKFSWLSLIALGLYAVFWIIRYVKLDKEIEKYKGS